MASRFATSNRFSRGPTHDDTHDNTLSAQCIYAGLPATVCGQGLTRGRFLVGAEGAGPSARSWPPVGSKLYYDERTDDARRLEPTAESPVWRP